MMRAQSRYFIDGVSYTCITKSEVVQNFHIAGHRDGSWNQRFGALLSVGVQYEHTDLLCHIVDAGI